MKAEDRLFAVRIAAIASIELGRPLGGCRCLVLGEGAHAQALLRELEGRALAADGAARGGARYELIVLTGEEPQDLARLAAPDALVLDAAAWKAHRALYDPETPLRRVRVLVLPSSKDKK